jgi:hypothetical protein
MTDLSEGIVEQYAAHLEKKAASVVLNFAVGGAIVGAALGGVPRFLPHNLISAGGASYFAVLLGAIAGGFLGRTLGEKRAVGLRLQAQMALHQLQVEQRFAQPIARPVAPAPAAAQAAPAPLVAPAPVAAPAPASAPAPAPAAPAVTAPEPLTVPPLLAPPPLPAVSAPREASTPAPLAPAVSAPPASAPAPPATSPPTTLPAPPAVSTEVPVALTPAVSRFAQPPSSALPPLSQPPRSADSRG